MVRARTPLALCLIAFLLAPAWATAAPPTPAAPLLFEPFDSEPAWTPVAPPPSAVVLDGELHLFGGRGSCASPPEGSAGATELLCADGQPFTLEEAYEGTTFLSAPTPLAGALRIDAIIRFGTPSLAGLHGGLIVSETPASRDGSERAITFDYLQTVDQFRVQSWENGVPTSVGGQSTVQYPQGYHRWTLFLLPTRVVALVDDGLISYALLDGFDGPVHVGFWTYDGGEIVVDSVTVRAYEAPSIDEVPDIHAVATRIGGAVVHYEAAAYDGTGAPLRVSCTRPSGFLFFVGVQPVTCRAEDGAGTVVETDFEVTVVEVIDVTLEGFEGRTFAADALGYPLTARVAYGPLAMPVAGARVTVSLERADGAMNGMTVEGVTDATGAFTFEVPTEQALPGAYVADAAATFRTAQDAQAATFEVGLI